MHIHIPEGKLEKKREKEPGSVTWVENSFHKYIFSFLSHAVLKLAL